MFDRIFKNWRTTALGTTVIIASLLLVYFEKATLTEAGYASDSYVRLKTISIMMHKDSLPKALKKKLGL